MYEKLELLIDGEWRAGSDGKTEPVINPATEETIGDLPHASAQDLDHALAAAEKAFPVWRDTAPYDRGKIMQKAAALMRERSKEIAETLVLEEGKVFAEAHIEVMVSADITDACVDMRRDYLVEVGKSPFEIEEEIKALTAAEAAA